MMMVMVMVRSLRSRNGPRTAADASRVGGIIVAEGIVWLDGWCGVNADEMAMMCARVYLSSLAYVALTVGMLRSVSFSDGTWIMLPSVATRIATGISQSSEIIAELATWHCNQLKLLQKLLHGIAIYWNIIITEIATGHCIQVKLLQKLPHGIAINFKLLQKLPNGIANLQSAAIYYRFLSLRFVIHRDFNQMWLLQKLPQGIAIRCTCKYFTWSNCSFGRMLPLRLINCFTSTTVSVWSFCTGDLS